MSILVAHPGSVSGRSTAVPRGSRPPHLLPLLALGAQLPVTWKRESPTLPAGLWTPSLHALLPHPTAQERGGLGGQAGALWVQV